MDRCCWNLRTILAWSKILKCTSVISDVRVHPFSFFLKLFCVSAVWEGKQGKAMSKRMKIILYTFFISLQVPEQRAHKCSSKKYQSVMLAIMSLHQIMMTIWFSFLSFFFAYQCVNQLASETRSVMKGNHSRKTAAFVRVCWNLFSIKVTFFSLHNVWIHRIHSFTIKNLFLWESFPFQLLSDAMLKETTTYWGQHIFSAIKESETDLYLIEEVKETL